VFRCAESWESGLCHTGCQQTASLTIVWDVVVAPDLACIKLRLHICQPDTFARLFGNRTQHDTQSSAPIQPPQSRCCPTCQESTPQWAVCNDSNTQLPARWDDICLFAVTTSWSRLAAAALLAGPDNTS
jgi:hypothetical protein